MKQSAVITVPISDLDIRKAFLMVVEEYSAVKEVCLKEAYEFCETYFSTLDERENERVFPTYKAFQRFRLRKMLSPDVSIEADFEPESPEMEFSWTNSEGVYGMSIVTRDTDGRKHPRLNEVDNLKRDEDLRFLEDIVRIVNRIIDNPPKDRKHITLGEIRSECSRNRKERAKEFSLEIAIQNG